MNQNLRCCNVCRKSLRILATAKPHALYNQDCRGRRLTVTPVGCLLCFGFLQTLSDGDNEQLSEGRQISVKLFLPDLHRYFNDVLIARVMILCRSQGVR